jgi:hypothetical protein
MGADQRRRVGVELGKALEIAFGMTGRDARRMSGSGPRRRPAARDQVRRLAERREVNVVRVILPPDDPALLAVDAALIDGCGYLKFFRYVTLPLSRPILGTVGIIAFVHSWNSYLLPLILLNRDTMYPWPLGIMVYQGEYSTDWNLILAFVTLTILPAIAMFLTVQKHIVAGLTAGAVKG